MLHYSFSLECEFLPLLRFLADACLNQPAHATLNITMHHFSGNEHEFSCNWDEVQLRDFLNANRHGEIQDGLCYLGIVGLNFNPG